MAKALSLGFATELKRCCVMHDNDARLGSCSPRRLPEVRRQDCFGRHLLVPEEAVRRLELGIIERLRKAGTGTLTESVAQSGQSSI